MSSSTSPLCAVCDQSTTQRCPNCKTPICSRVCQTRIWPTHKFTCKQPQDRFTVPFFSDEELRDLEAVKDKTGFLIGPSFMSVVKDQLRFNGSWSTIAEILTCKREHADATFMLLAGRDVLEMVYTGKPKIDGKMAGISPWQLSASSLFRVAMAYSPRREALTRLAPVMRHQLVFHTLYAEYLSRAGDTGRNDLIPPMLVSLRRARQGVKDLHLPLATMRAMLEHIDGAGESYEELFAEDAQDPLAGKPPPGGVRPPFGPGSGPSPQDEMLLKLANMIRGMRPPSPANTRLYPACSAIPTSHRNFIPSAVGDPQKPQCSPASSFVALAGRGELGEHS